MVYQLNKTEKGKAIYQISKEEREKKGPYDENLHHNSRSQNSTAMIKPKLNKYYHKKPINIYASDKQKKERQ